MQFGGHVSSSGGISTAVDRAEELGMDALQLFTQSPRMWRPTNHAPDALARFRERRREAGIGDVVCHALYLINLASPDPELHAKSVSALLTTVEVATAIEADGVVLHVGSHLGRGLDAALPLVLPALREALDRCAAGPTWVLLENSAGAGGTIGRSLDELAVIHDALGAPDRLGLCLDSCHLWVSGTDVTDPAVVDALVEDVDARFGLDRLRCLHVNDALTALGSNRDRHANIGDGQLGEGLGAFLGHPRLQHLPAVLETPGADGHGPDAEEMRKVRELHARWTPGAR
ncbi:MAG: deoxyribonuclease IV [Thermoleophilia bacterium]